MNNLTEQSSAAFLRSKNLILLTGTLSSGKTTLIRDLKEKYKFRYISSYSIAKRTDDILYEMIKNIKKINDKSILIVEDNLLDILNYFDMTTVLLFTPLRQLLINEFNNEDDERVSLDLIIIQYVYFYKANDDEVQTSSERSIKNRIIGLEKISMNDIINFLKFDSIDNLTLELTAFHAAKKLGLSTKRRDEKKWIVPRFQYDVIVTLDDYQELIKLFI